MTKVSNSTPKKCEFCKQWGQAFTQCSFCGAPINQGDNDEVTKIEIPDPDKYNSFIDVTPYYTDNSKSESTAPKIYSDRNL